MSTHTTAQWAHLAQPPHRFVPPQASTDELLACASEAAYLDGERAGYVRGARDGRGAGFCWGALLCAGLVALAVQAGYWAGL